MTFLSFACYKKVIGTCDIKDYVCVNFSQFSSIKVGNTKKKKNQEGAAGGISKRKCLQECLKWCVLPCIVVQGFQVLICGEHSVLTNCTKPRWYKRAEKSHEANEVS